MELDTGAAMTAMSKRSFEELWVSRAGGVPKLHPTSTCLITYTQESHYLLWEWHDGSDGSIYVSNSQVTF